jgi:hypothetical protein
VTAAPNLEPCPTCTEPVGAHTVDQLAAHLSDVADFHLPFEEFDREQEQTLDPHGMAGSIVVKAAAIRSSIGVYPVLVFEFSGPAGPMPPISLVLDDNRMRDVRHLVGTAIDAAIKGARKHRR